MFTLPLKPGDAEVPVDLQTLLLQIYNQARYDLAIDYRQEPVPLLQEADRAWADALLKRVGIAVVLMREHDCWSRSPIAVASDSTQILCAIALPKIERPGKPAF